MFYDVNVIEFAKNDNMVCDEILMFVQAPKSNLQDRYWVSWLSIPNVYRKIQY